MKKLLPIITATLITCISANLASAQIIDGAYMKRTTIDRKPAPLPMVREADAIWSRTVWRLVDLREKSNQQFYYPTHEIQGRKNLITLLMNGVKDNTILAYDATDNENEFKTPVSYNQVRQQFGDSTRSIKVTDLSTNIEHDSIVATDIPLHEVKQLEIKEVWYFDKQLSTLQVRILGICPIRVYKKDPADPALSRKKLFWVYYPEVRPLLARNESLNGFNGARSLSFDDLFLTRKFDGSIVKEENTYDNRAISQYASGEFVAQESARIKNSIFNYEQDLWEY